MVTLFSALPMGLQELPRDCAVTRRRNSLSFENISSIGVSPGLYVGSAAGRSHQPVDRCDHSRVLQASGQVVGHHDISLVKGRDRGHRSTYVWKAAPGPVVREMLMGLPALSRPIAAVTVTDSHDAGAELRLPAAAGARQEAGVMGRLSTGLVDKNQPLGLDRLPPFSGVERAFLPHIGSVVLLACWVFFLRLMSSFRKPRQRIMNIC